METILSTLINWCCGRSDEHDDIIYAELDNKPRKTNYVSMISSTLHSYETIVSISLRFICIATTLVGSNRDSGHRRWPHKH